MPTELSSRKEHWTAHDIEVALMIIQCIFVDAWPVDIFFTASLTRSTLTRLLHMTCCFVSLPFNVQLRPS